MKTFLLEYMRAIVIIVTMFVVFTSLELVHADKVKISMMVDTRSNYRAWQEAVVKEFEKEYEHIEVEMQIPSGGIAQFIIIRSAAGVAPDLAFHDPHTIIDFTRLGLIADLTPYMDRDSDHFSDWYPSALAFYQYGGGHYGLPQDLQLGAIFYNVDTYNEAGLPMPSPDWTYENMRDNARKLTVSDGQSTIIRHGFRIPTWRNWLSIIWAHGGDYVDSWTEPTQFIGRSDQVVDGIEYLKSLVDTQAVQDKATHGSMTVNTGFSQQLIAMGQSNTIAIDTFRDIEDFTWDVVPLPIGPAGQVSFLNARGWFIMNDSPHKEEAWSLLRYFTSPKALKMLVHYVGSVPPNREGVLDHWLPSMDMPKSRALLITGLGTARPPGELADSVYSPISTETHSVIWGEKPLNAALEDMERLVNQAINELNKSVKQ